MHTPSRHHSVVPDRSAAGVCGCVVIRSLMFGCTTWWTSCCCNVPLTWLLRPILSHFPPILSHLLVSFVTGMLCHTPYLPALRVQRCTTHRLHASCREHVLQAPFWPFQQLFVHGNACPHKKSTCTHGCVSHLSTPPHHITVMWKLSPRGCGLSCSSGFGHICFHFCYASCSRVAGRATLYSVLKSYY